MLRKHEIEAAKTVHLAVSFFNFSAVCCASVHWIFGHRWFAADHGSLTLPQSTSWTVGLHARSHEHFRAKKLGFHLNHVALHGD